ncbi:MAG: type IV pilus modification PilV family protein [Acidimicrobiia bacterium]
MQPIDRRDGGFTLIEAAVALLIATFIFVALGQTIATALRASEARRLEQQADALIAEVIEGVRDFEYADLALDSGDVTLLPITSFDAGTGPEPLIVETGGSLTPQVSTETFNTITFTLTRYVTWVDDDPLDTSTEDYKRMTVVASWDHRGSTRTEQRDTLVSLAEPGATTPATSYGVSINPASDAKNGAAGDFVTYTHTIENIGSGADTFELTVTNDLGWPVTMRSVDTGVAPVDTNGNGTPDTGELALTGDTYDLEVIVQVPGTMGAGTSSSTILEATSAGDSGMSASAEDTTTSTGLTAAPYDVEYFLKSGFALSPTTPTGSYTTTSGESGTTKTWLVSPGQDWEATGNATVRLFVGRRGTCASGTVEYTATLRTTSGTWGSQASGPISVSGCDPTQLSTVTIPIIGETISSGQTLYLDILMTEPSSGQKAKRGLTVGFDGTAADSSVTFEVVDR